jgi:cytoplasmic iron level regulating protein YaaA (DUF328/UPF0246 family)
MKTIQIQKLEIVNKTKREAIEAIKVLREFVPRNQLNVIVNAMRSEEKQFFFNKACELADMIKSMPVTYEQDGKGQKAVAYLHYFRGNMDWYITEKDIGSPEDARQLQAFGLADMGTGYPELGYISIVELLENQIELDMYFTPTELENIKER